MRIILICISVLFLCLPSSAQENAKKGEQRPYATNSGFFDNTYIGVGGGINIQTGDYDISHEYETSSGGTATNFNTNNIRPSIDIFFGKWWTPVVGARLAYHGYQLSGYTTDLNGPFVSQDWDLACGHVREQMNYNAGRIDITLNLCNAIQGYRSDRFWDVIPYLGFGAANINGKNIRTGDRTDVWRFLGDVGILNTLRLCHRWGITLDVRYSMSDNFFDLNVSADNHKIDGILTASAGIAVKLGRVGFRHSQTPDYSAYENELDRYKRQLDELNAALAARGAQIGTMNDELTSLENMNAELRDKHVIKDGTIVLYFAINKSVLDSKELSILDAFIKGLENQCKVTIKATSDRKSGSKEYNRKLSEKRAEYLSKLIQDKYGLTVESSAGMGETDTHTNPVLNRAGIIYVSFE